MQQTVFWGGDRREKERNWYKREKESRIHQSDTSALLMLIRTDDDHSIIVPRVVTTDVVSHVLI